MSKIPTFSVHESVDGTVPLSMQPLPDALTAAIRKALEALDAAAEEAENGRLGAAKLGLLVAANGIIDAIKAADAEFARRGGTGRA
jgi:hypothetical protein